MLSGIDLLNFLDLERVQNINQRLCYQGQKYASTAETLLLYFGASQGLRTTKFREVHNGFIRLPCINLEFINSLLPL